MAAKKIEAKRKHVGMAIATIAEDLKPIVPTTIVNTKISAVRMFPPNSATIIEDQPVLS